MKNTLALLFVIALLASCTIRQDKHYKLGELTFDVTGSADAMPSFMKGYMLLHSFEYVDAAEAFVEAQKIDPDFVMAYWGEAMTYNHSIWQEQDLEKGRKALQKIGKTQDERNDKITNPLERDLIHALDILYGEGTKTSRDKAYAEYMGKLYEKYPNHHEVASLYAISLLGSVPVGRNDEIYQTSARISAQVLQENPNHPGALHYFIHANDDPDHARSALSVANSYAVVAPDAAHALHMPTHIYVAMGMWDEVVSSNEQSWHASVKRREVKNLNGDALGFHSFHWLQYGYLQQGRFEGAAQMLSDMTGYTSELPSKKARAHEIFLKSTYLVETGDWDSKWPDHSTDAADLNISTRSLEYFVEGMKYYTRGSSTALEGVITKMENDRKREEKLISNDGVALCGSGGASRENATRLDIDISLIIEWQLRAHLALLNDQTEYAETLLKMAAEKEDNITYAYGPPSVVKPSHELYGEFLLKRNRPGEAMVQFDEALKRAPRRVLSLKGKLESARMLKNATLENELSKQLDEILKHQRKPVPSMVTKV